MQTRHVIGDRPFIWHKDGDSFIPEDWIICNAPRPIRGTKTWEGPFITGVLYAGIAPDDCQRDWMIMNNTCQDAVQVFYHKKEDVAKLGLGYYKEKYPDTIDEIDPVKDIDFLVSAGMRILRGE